jgi:hypothetical protein
MLSSSALCRLMVWTESWAEILDLFWSNVVFCDSSFDSSELTLVTSSDKIAPPEDYLGAVLAKTKNGSGNDCWTLSGSLNGQFFHQGRSSIVDYFAFLKIESDSSFSSLVLRKIGNRRIH